MLERIFVILFSSNNIAFLVASDQLFSSTAIQFLRSLRSKSYKSKSFLLIIGMLPPY